MKRLGNGMSRRNVAAAWGIAAAVFTTRPGSGENQFDYAQPDGTSLRLILDPASRQLIEIDHVANGIVTEVIERTLPDPGVRYTWYNCNSDPAARPVPVVLPPDTTN